MVELAVTTALIVTLGPGVLSPASPGVLERVQETRLRYGYGLSEPAPAGAVLLGVQDCRLLGRTGWAIVAGVGWVPVYIVDCQQAEHRPLSELGIVADVNDVRMAHRKAMIWLQ